MDQVTEPRASYGGEWTIEKLKILERYLDAYTTALKDQLFKLVYIDAFAGSGSVELRVKYNLDPEAKGFLAGSVQRALQVKDKPFDKMIFVEKDAGECEKLKQLCGDYPDRDTEVVNKDANDFLRNDLELDWNKWRGVLFLDPFATEVEWSTIKKIATFNALDTWILFPVSAIARMLKNVTRLEDIPDSLARRLTSIYGDYSWQGLYHESPQLHMFGDNVWERDPGVDGLLKIYKQKLRNLLGPRLLEESRSLRNSKNAILFEFMFCVGNERGIKPAKRIAGHILNNM
ncbi:MAG: hypothetical protein M2R45_03466 [Verrucomicrobia subdivision 3 bacterium]|nr:hypothetical protein [Limisphaerales bacterium]MCS1416683.1 hypothetical protein [Limisphaerales bacterium]